MSCLEPGTKLPWGRQAELAPTAYVPSGRPLLGTLIVVLMLIILCSNVIEWIVGRPKRTANVGFQSVAAKLDRLIR